MPIAGAAELIGMCQKFTQNFQKNHGQLLEALDAELRTRGALACATLVRTHDIKARIRIFFAAVELGHIDVARSLLTEGVIATEGEDGGIALVMAAKRGHAALVECLLARGARDFIPTAQGPLENASLAAAMAFGHLECTRLLLAASSGPPPIGVLLEVINSRQLAFVKLVVDAGADVSAKIVVFAAQREAPDILELLLPAAGDVDEMGLLVALLSANSSGDYRSIRVLIRAGASLVVPGKTDRLRGQKLVKTVGLVSVSPITDAEEIADRRERGCAFVEAIYARGGWRPYVAEPRFSLVLLRRLCLADRALIRRRAFRLRCRPAVPPALAERLFGVGIDRLFAGPAPTKALPMRVFRLIVEYWWGGIPG